MKIKTKVSALIISSLVVTGVLLSAWYELQTYLDDSRECVGNASERKICEGIQSTRLD